ATSAPVVTEPSPNSAAREPAPESELELIQGAVAARSQSAQALALLDRHERLYPRGALAQEREVLAIEVLLRAGEPARAKARASRFAAAYPGSAHLPRIHALISRAHGE